MFDQLPEAATALQPHLDFEDYTDAMFLHTTGYSAGEEQTAEVLIIKITDFGMISNPI